MSNPESSIFDEPDDQAEAEALARAEGDLAAGRTISHKAMKRWLLSWGKSDELPPPKCGE